MHYWYYPGETIGKEFVYPKDQAVKIAARTHETVLRFLPPYVIQRKHVDQLVKALNAALRRNAESAYEKTLQREKTATPAMKMRRRP